MLWGSKKDEELPDELKGKTPAEIVAMLGKAKDFETAAANAETARKDIEARLTAQTSEFDTVKTRLNELEAGHKTDAKDDDEPPSPWVDPQKFVADATKATHAVALNAGLMAAKMYFIQNLSSRDQKIHKKYEKEVEQVVGTFAPEARVMPQSWFNALLYVKGLHEVDIAKAESTNTDFFAEPASRGTREDHNEPPADKLTPEEEAVCKSMHWDPAQYLKNKKEGQLAGHDKGMHATYRVPTRSA